MKETRIMWDMPITVEIADKQAEKIIFEDLFTYFKHVDTVFNTFSESSEISRINRGEILREKWSNEIKEVLFLCEQTKQETEGYFEYKRNGLIDPLGIVKGWAVQKGAQILQKKGFNNFYIDAGGDIQVQGYKNPGKKWSVGIRNPFNRNEHIKILSLTDCGIATSGNYIRGNHIFNPFHTKKPPAGIVSITVIGYNVYEADRFATAAFAQGTQGIYFIEKTPGLEGYMIDQKGIATYTSGFEKKVNL